MIDALTKERDDLEHRVQHLLELKSGVQRLCEDHKKAINEHFEAKKEDRFCNADVTLWQSFGVGKFEEVG